ncbi:hypothetical protein [Foetidibacter luteolus]|uniref:hypothetical protein n=1 Tax=Foetidibacter luteolus TaxID=2608880 RepID=UPI00129B74E0|nr:hypothetical protein [Foetidibacter luteolus]
MLRFVKQIFVVKSNTFKNNTSKSKKSSIVKDEIKESKDELLGFWENGADDGSGLHAIWGYGVEFLPEGKGFTHHWGGDVPEDEKRIEILWKRNNAKSVSCKYEDGEEWETVEYEITDFIGAYDSPCHKIVEKGKNEFWSSPEPLYRHKL